MKTYQLDNTETVVLTKDDKNYPKPLFDLVDPPQKIMVRGSLELLSSSKILAIVGSRRMSRYGAEATSFFAERLALSGVTIISGFMYGVDTVAHKATIEAGGKTIAVLAHGLNYIYPPENAYLYNKIIQTGGALVSEYSDDFKPQLWTYPKRNRIVAALATLGTLIVEAGEQSGSLITASFADALNRNLYAVPGNIFSSVSKGTNELIKNGVAKLISEPSEIIGDNKKVYEEVPLFKSIDSLESKIIDLLEKGEADTDEIARELNLQISEAMSTITKLCIRGVVREFQGKYSIIRRK